MAARECAVHCRYCFRRHYPYEAEPAGLSDWAPALETLSADPSVREVILSGGDPLILTDRRLGELIGALESIPHLRRLRIHSRLPIVLPDRIDEGLLALLRGTALTTVLVVHANHPAEIVGDCAAALRRLVTAGIPTLNQSVLLRGVNDDVETLAELSERLIDLGVIPYYLHQLDRVTGTAHFEVGDDEAGRLVEGLRTRLPGYAVPRLVREVPGAASKLPVGLEG
jgi:EF-P beta-lysylation protein EpmB